MHTDTLPTPAPQIPDRRDRSTTKVAVVVRDDLASWPGLMGETYRDADDTAYLPLFGQPVLIFAVLGDLLHEIHARAVRRELDLSIFTSEMFTTGNDIDNRRVVRAVTRDDLDLVGLAVHGPRNAVDKTTKGAQLHR